MSSSREEVLRAIETHRPDWIYIDAQHGPHSEWDVKRICDAAMEEGIGVNLRIDHFRNCYNIGSYLDLGLLGIKIPEVREVHYIDDALEAFYFPSIGARSWGGVGFMAKQRKATENRREYADWWNETGILGFKIESIEATEKIRQLVKPGIVYVDFGPNDLLFDLEAHPESRFKTIQDCKDFVAEALADVEVAISLE